MANLNDLIAKQSQIMGTVCRALPNFKKLGAANMTLAVTRRRYDSLKDSFARCQQLDAEIWAQADEKDRSTQPYFTEGQFLDCEERFNEAADFMVEVLEKAVRADAAINANPPFNPTERSASRLPNLRLPTFDGSFDQWETFRDKFTSMIINDPGLSNVDRMHYLTSCLSGAASSALSHLTITDANFPIAWNTLSSRYDNKRRLITLHLDALHNLPTVKFETSQSLRELRDRTNASIQALANLGRPVKEWDDILVYLVTQKLDSATRKAWELQLGDTLEYPAFDKLKGFLDARILALESLPEIQKHNGTNPNPNNNKQGKERCVPAHSVTVTSACPICRANHLIKHCDRFCNQSPSQRYESIRTSKRCINCFSSKHSVRDCPSELVCKRCGKKHHTVLHFASNTTTTPNDSSASLAPTRNIADVPVSTHLVSEYDATRSHVLLATARVRVYSPTGHFLTVRALLDQGSAATVITENLVQLLRLPKIRRPVRISGVGESETTVQHAVTVTITPAKEHQPAFSTTALVIKSLTKYTPRCVGTPNQWPHIASLNLADSDPLSSDPVDVLIGADLYGMLILNGVRKGANNQPSAQNTVLGWILSGPVTPISNSFHVHLHHTAIEPNLDAELRRFWQIEELPERTLLNPEEQRCEDHFQSTHSRTPEGRYMVRLPFKTPPSDELGASKPAALSRLLLLERRLIRDPAQLTAYRQFLTEYLKLQHMEPASPINKPNSCSYYIPHHAVFKKDSETTPLRVVFNASCPTSTGKSLNDCLLTGPKLQNDLPSVLLRWRHFQYVYTADSAKMYRQILVDPRDRDYQRILWRSTASGPISEFCLRTVTYGTAPAAYLAQRVLKQLVEDEGCTFPLATPVINEQSYVDDFLFGADNPHLALQTREQVIALLGKGGFRLRKWASNCPALLEGIENSDHGLASEKSLAADEHLKVLGVSWHPGADTLKFHVNLPSTCANSKRGILSVIARLFDPLGLVTPVTITAKIMLQKLWLLQCDWDETAPSILLREWQHYYAGLHTLRNIAIPRWTCRNSQSLQYSLHGFADASSQAYAAVVYSRVIQPNGSISISLLMAKAKVAPVKTVSIPRLELLAAHLLSRLIVVIRSALPFNNINCHCWTDSTIVLAWLRQSPSHWQTFVANRVAKIQNELPDVTWLHVPTRENPADCASRGLSPEELQAHNLWWEGPAWLRSTNSPWPSQPPTLAPNLLPEKRQNTITCAVAMPQSDPSWITRFSSWPRLLRVTAYIIRFLTKVRSHNKSRTPTNACGSTVNEPKVLYAHEIQHAKIVVLRTIQRESFPQETERLINHQKIPNSSPLAPLNPFVDADGLIRVGGRLDKSNLPDKTKHPIVLRSHPAVTALITHHHLRTLHAGPSLTLASLRDEFWILRARAVIRTVLYRCVPCARENAIVPTELMGTLPSVRTNRTSRAFIHTGVDYAGPILVRNASGRGYKSHKAYIALFICMTTKAIHLELVHDYGSAAFIAALQRFISRRGLPQSLYSDNGTTFQGANRELANAYRQAIRDPNLLNKISTEAVNWHFLPPAAPHFGGLWEAGVRSVKRHLNRCIGSHTLTTEEMTTILCRIEACLNSRPIAAVSENLDDYHPLTPGHFLIGAPLIALPEPSILKLNENRLSRWQLIQRITEGFWQAWSKEYLHTLQQRPKWRVVQRLAKIGRLVLLRNPLTPPCQWDLGRIVSCHPGADGLTRVVTVKTAKSTYIRPLAKLCFLPVNINEETALEESMAGGVANKSPTQ